MTTLREMVESLKDRHALLCSAGLLKDDSGARYECDCVSKEQHAKIDAILARLDGHVLIRQQLLKDAVFEYEMMYDHIGRPMTPETTSTLLSLQALLAASEAAK